MARLDQTEIEQRVQRLEEWSLEGEAIKRSFDCGNFLGSVALVDGIAPVAEDMGHHPDIAISWATVTVTITTHSEGGLTAADFELAERIDALA
jgi:4a-hydroxytetrahydrobiopterin dehydratase